MTLVWESLVRRTLLFPFLSVLAAGSAFGQSYPALSETVLDGIRGRINYVTVADLNRDGIDDIVALDDMGTPFSGPAVLIYVGRADGSFSAPVVYPVDYGIGGLVIADMNLDGIPDIVMASGSQAEIMYGDGSGGFAPTALFPLTYTFGKVTGLVATSRDQSSLPAACLSQGRCGPQGAVVVAGTTDYWSNTLPAPPPSSSGRRLPAGRCR